MEALIHFTHEMGEVDFPLIGFFLKAFFVLFVVISFVLFVYDRFIQRENQLLINYPLIGRLRYIFYALRDPMRQYFGDEKFYESFDKVKWVYDAAQRKSAYASFAPSQPQKSAKSVYRIIKLLLNGSIAQKVYKQMVVDSKAPDSYLFSKEEMVFYRVNWDADLSVFPKSVPDDMPDIIFQMGSGLYGVRDKDGSFCPTRYQKTMRFCKMTEIKMAQGAKQTGGKLLASKVSEEIAYYRGVSAHKDLFSPNQFPYAHNLEELFDFIGRLKELSQKPVGVKIVISSQEGFDAYAQLIKQRLQAGSLAYPDFLTIDGGDGGSGAAPLEMMMTVGMTLSKALYIADKTLKELGVRKEVKLIASEKVLTPDDPIVLFGLGADYVAIARAFMMSAGCIRARECLGANGRACPVGLATQDKRKRASFLIEKKARNIASYHEQLLYGMRNLLAVMGVDHIAKLTKENLMFKDTTGKTYMDVTHYFEESIKA
ncbi:MAG: FMN-binding glutamate synthase family protein [Epsilonproteobacteria bacterium]|nr:FMN-binding glutamate synthase family protein [Campylobacterota bacterium]